ncbi:hypothetical protein chiPu_0021967 [Chiloscyllium punctatum]|uniref:Uncharacterized protein n=1 Tax=Chiloscyllium punctatum TaxID=137246 RepID=A0A401RGC0_CHIPU|nr:hypothetical protein [Chiloscyllium punctatum]
MLRRVWVPVLRGVSRCLNQSDRGRLRPGNGPGYCWANSRPALRSMNCNRGRLRHSLPLIRVERSKPVPNLCEDDGDEFTNVNLAISNFKMLLIN